MKKLFFAFLFIAGHAVSVFSETPADSAKTDNRGYLVKVGDKVSSGIRFTLTDGKKVALDDLKGKVVLLQFTASWCSVCRKEMPYLESEIWQANKNKDFVLIGVDRDEPLEKVAAFKKAINVTYPLALDPGADIFALFADRKAGVTRNVLIDREGKIVFLTRLYDPAEFSALVKKVDETLSAPLTAKANR